MEISVTRFFFGRKSHFFQRNCFWCRSCKRKILGVKSRVGKNPPFFQKKRRGNTRTTQQLPLLPEEVKHLAPTDILGTSGTGKAMEPWLEGWFLYLSPADGGKNVEQTHHDRKQKNAICRSVFGKRYQNDYLAAGAIAYKAQASDTTSVRSPRANYILLMQPSCRGANYKKSPNTRLSIKAVFVSDAFGFAGGFMFRAQASRISFATLPTLEQIVGRSPIDPLRPLSMPQGPRHASHG